jgi:hypothetical protein
MADFSGDLAEPPVGIARQESFKAFAARLP